VSQRACLGLAKNGNSTATYNFLHLCDKASAISLCRSSSAWTSGTRIFNKSMEVAIATLPAHSVYLIRRIEIHVLT
jgi:hypothetical protein